MTFRQLWVKVDHDTAATFAAEFVKADLGSHLVGLQCVITLDPFDVFS